MVESPSVQLEIFYKEPFLAALYFSNVAAIHREGSLFQVINVFLPPICFLTRKVALMFNFME